MTHTQLGANFCKLSFLVERVPLLKSTNQKKIGYPYSTLSTGGPRPVGPGETYPPFGALCFRVPSKCWGWKETSLQRPKALAIVDVSAWFLGVGVRCLSGPCFTVPKVNGLRAVRCSLGALAGSQHGFCRLRFEGKVSKPGPRDVRFHVN